MTSRLRALLPAALLAVTTGGCLERRDNDTAVAREECTTCHGGTLAAPFEAAPPINLSGEDERTARGNGAHAAHLLASDRARPLTCDNCHSVPDTLYAAGHVDSAYPAEVKIESRVASAFEATPEWDVDSGTCKNTFCHGGYFVGGRPSGGTHPEPSWTSADGVEARCGGCHGLPPPAPHPEVEGCTECHENSRPDGSFVDPNRHVDGVVDFYLGD